MKTYAEYSVLKSKCGGNTQTVMEWARWLEDMIGPPEGCNQFVIRTREKYCCGMFITQNGWASQFNSAQLFDWEETAVRITNNRFLEAIKIDKEGVAISSDDEIVGVW